MTDITDCPDCYKKYLQQNKGSSYSCDVMMACTCKEKKEAEKRSREAYKKIKEETVF